MSRVIAVLALAFGLIAALSSPAGAATRTPTGPWVAVQTAASGELTRIAGTSRDYRLVLRGVAPTVKTFDDSPGDGAGDVSVRTLLDGLFHLDGGATHNAGITVGSKTMAVRLLSGSYHARSRTASYRVRALRGGDRLPRRFARPALFIDDIGETATAPAICVGRFSVPPLMTFDVAALVQQPLNSTWVKQPASVGGSLVEWETVAASATTPCGSEVDLAIGPVGEQVLGTIAHLEIESATPDNPNGTATCQLSGEIASTHTCSVTLTALAPQGVLAWATVASAS